MINWRSLKKKYFKSTEEVISMFLGLVIVVVVVGLIFNFFQKRKGNVEIPGVSNYKITEETNKSSEKSQENIYEVAKGDSLWKIAQTKYNDGYKWTEIAKANNIKNTGSIEVGQKIVLPNVEVKETIVANDNLQKDVSSILAGSEYKVAKGDSLWKIAVRAYGDGYQWVEIWKANKSKLINPNGLEIGMVLSIPALGK